LPASWRSPVRRRWRRRRWRPRLRFYPSKRYGGPCWAAVLDRVGLLLMGYTTR
jgi:hypothetical protein